MENLSYWALHGILPGLLLGLGLALVPRITLLLMLAFTSFVSGGFLWWLGWFFLPHILVAGLATLAYWDTNPVLVIMAWIWALIGTGTETSTVHAKAAPKDR